jgi:hypothetical protein
MPRLTAALILCLTASLTAAEPAAPENRVLDAKLHHLRIDGPREWDEFPENPESASLTIEFDSEPNRKPATLGLRQQDVKQDWHVRLNDAEIGRLRQDENGQVVYFVLPPGSLKSEKNSLRIEQSTGARPVPDDIRVGEITLDTRLLYDVLSEASVEVTVVDPDKGAPLPARITIVRPDGALQTTGPPTAGHVAIRPGVIYTAEGRASLGLPAGRYRIYAGRGFEYSLASEDVTLAPGERLTRTLPIRREVPTPGLVACDTHIHTLTHSGHGDATIEERMVTLAGEGIELPIATDHNTIIDDEATAQAAGVRRDFTPVAGDEVTTRLGHFNVFPLDPNGPTPDANPADWRTLFTGLRSLPGPKAVILNHPRDIHSNFRPFGPERFNAAVAEPLDGRPLRFDAVEVVNSGATQNDPLLGVRDWMALLGVKPLVTPVGASDSHDVSRYIVGQGRTYVRADDRDPGAIDVPKAVENFLAGRVSVSYGLLTELTVEDRFGSGDLAPVASDEVRVSIRVLGPHWTTATHVELFANGVKIHEADITPADQVERGVKWAGGWTIPKPKHDVPLVAVARGPGVTGNFWRTAKPYQPTSPRFESYVLGVSGAVWLDADGDGRRTTAREYADRLLAASAGDLNRLVGSLAGYDETVAAHAALLADRAGHPPADPTLRTALESANPATRAGFTAYFEAWRESQAAQASRP